MNISHRSIWNSALGAWVAVSEITRGRGKRSGGGSAVLAGAALLLIPTLGFAQATATWTVTSGKWETKASWKNSTSPGINTAVTMSTGTAQITATTPNGSTTIGSLAGTGGTIAIATGKSLTTGGNNTSTTYGGVINGLGSVTKQGTGTMTLTAVNTYAGGTTISKGTLALGAGGKLAATGAVNLNGSGAGFNIAAATGNQTIGSLAGITGTTVTLGANTLIFGDTSSQTFGGVIGGTGGLTKQGTGTQTLTGVNTYTGTTTISAGTLALGAGGKLAATGAVNLSGSGATFDITASNQTIGSLAGVAGTKVTLGARTLTLGDASTDKSFAGVIGGTGGLTKQGTGTQTLTGANTYTGTTTISAGTLALGAGGKLAATGAVNLSGTGAAFNIAAAGNQTIGSLAGVAGTNVTLGVNTLIFGDTSSQTFGGVIGGTGGLVKQGTGTQTLTGANTYIGGTTVSGGVLQGDSTSLQGNITNNAQLTFDQAATGTYAGVMSGTGALNKIGSGNLTLSGINSLTGATSINAGTLTVNGSIASSAVSINNGAMLSGNGTVGNLNVLSGGVLSPGNPMGTLSVKGNATFASGSTYRVDANAAGNTDRVNVSGNAIINGGKVDVQAGTGTYMVNTSYTVLNAAGGRTGTFAGVTSNLAFLTPTLGYDANNVFLTLTRNNVTYQAVAATANQGGTAAALQSAISGATGDMNTVLSALTSLSAEQARAAYDSVSGNSLVGLRGAGSSFSAGFGNQMQARMGAMQSSSAGGLRNSFSNRPVLLAANDHISDLMTPATVSDSPQKFALAGGAASSNLQSKNDFANGFWLRGSGGYQNTSGDSNAGASKTRNSGLSAGFDTEVREGLRAGVALSGGTSSLSTDSSTSGRSRSSAVALYGSYASGPWNFSGSTSLTYGSNHMDRTVTVGTINRVATSDFDSTTLSAYGEATYSMAMTGGWTLQPLAGLSLGRSKANGFTETGAGALNLQVAGQTTTSTKSLLGAKAAFEAGSVRLEPRAIWAHEFGDINTPMTAQFQGAAIASPFQVSGVALKRDTLILGLGASGSIKKNFDLFADVQAEHNSRQNNLAVLVGLRARW